MSAFIRFSLSHVSRGLSFSINDCCFGVLTASRFYHRSKYKHCNAKKALWEWVIGVYWWPPGEAKSAAWVHLAHLQSEPTPSCPPCPVSYSLCRTPWPAVALQDDFKSTFFAGALRVLPSKSGDCGNSCKRKELCHKARWEWVTNCMHGQNCCPKPCSAS